jgi:putative phosphoserine phosphatase/1-acylglycerol-3-phosphate O-acyltransferase
MQGVRGHERGPGAAQLARGLVAVLVGWCFTILYCAGILVFSIVTLRRWSRELVAPVAHGWAHVMLALCGVRVIHANESTLCDRRARLLMINHPSTFDPVWVALIVPPATMALGKREFIYYPGFNLAWWALRLGLIDRSNPEVARRTIAEVSERVQRERLSILMAPEGTRSRDGSLQAFKKGAFHLAMEARIPIFPVVASGAYEIWPRHRWLPVPGVVRLRFLPPVSTSDWKLEDLDAHIDGVRAAMNDALRTLEHTAA